jgi:hypothetical protein
MSNPQSAQLQASMTAQQDTRGTYRMFLQSLGDLRAFRRFIEPRLVDALIGRAAFGAGLPAAEREDAARLIVADVIDALIQMSRL